MAKKFVRKIIGVKDIQDLRDFTSEIGDIVIKDGIHAYIHVEDEYKPISYPMIWDYDVPQNKKSRSDKNVNRTGIHDKDTKYSTISQHDLTDGLISGFENVADDPSMINSLNTGYKYSIDKNKVDFNYRAGKNFYRWGLTKDSSYFNQINIYDSDGNENRVGTNISNGQIVYNAITKDLFLNYSVSDEFLEKIFNSTSGYRYTLDVSKYYSSIQATNKDNKGVFASINDNSADYTISYKNTEFTSQVDSEHINKCFYFNNRKNSIAFNFLSYHDVSGTQAMFEITGSDNFVQAYKKYMDQFLEITSRINDLQNQINNLSSRISSLEK